MNDEVGGVGYWQSTDGSATLPANTSTLASGVGTFGVTLATNREAEEELPIPDVEIDAK